MGVDAGAGAGARRLRALVVAQPTDGGVATCVRQLVVAARDAGHDVVLACPTDGGDLAARATVEGVRHVPVFDQRRLPAPRDVRDLGTLRRWAAGADVVHLHSSKAGLLGRLAVRSLPRRRRPAVVYTPHAWSWLIGGRVGDLLRVVERLLVRLCDVVVAVSEDEAEVGRAVLGAAAPIEVIANGVDLELFRPGDGDASPAPAAGAPPPDAGDRPLLVCVGRLARQKGQDVAIEALVHPALSDVHLRLVGGGPDREALLALAARHRVADRVTFTGEVDDVVTHYREADVVIAPSRWEGLSLAWLEALACGAALVVTDVAGADVVRGAAVVIDRPHPALLADAVAGLLADDAARGRLAVAARRRGEEHDLRGTLASNLALWERVVPERGPSPR